MPNEQGTTPESGGEEGITNDLLGLTGDTPPDQKTEEGKTPEGENPKEGEGEQTPPKKVFSQEEVNSLLATQKREHQERIVKYKAAGLSDEQIGLLDKKEEVQGSREELEQIRQERVQLLMDQNKELVGKLDKEYMEKLKTANPEEVALMFNNVKQMMGNQKPAQTPPEETGGEAQEQGNLESMEEGKVHLDGVSSEDMAIAEGIQKFQDSGDPTSMVQATIKSWNF